MLLQALILAMVAAAPLAQARHGTCDLPLETGPCRAGFRRFGFNSDTGKCERFIYGGCKGNANNFKTLKKCERVCPPPPPPQPADVCKLRLVTGPCYARFIRWGFSTRARKCVKFIYGGCGGNKNRFNTKHECIKACGK